MKRWTIAIGVIVGVVIALFARHRYSASPAPTSLPERGEPRVVRGAIKREGLHVDVYLPLGRAAASLMLVDDPTCPTMAEELQRRGIAVALVSASLKEEDRAVGERLAGAFRDVANFMQSVGLQGSPFVAGISSGASPVALLALETPLNLGSARVAGVVTINGAYEAPLRHVRADAPPFLVLSAHAETPERAQQARTFARTLERAGAPSVRYYHFASRNERAMCDLSGERNDVADLLVSFLRAERAPGGPESAWAVADAWGARAPLSTESFWSDARLIVRKPVDDPFRNHLGRIFATTMPELDPWPRQTYDAIDLSDYLAAHPELGSGGWLEVTNLRGEKLVLSRQEIAKEKPLIVVGIDDEKNLFRLLVTYNVYRTYTFKPETEPRPLLVRPVGAFLHFPGANDAPPRVVTFADFGLSPTSFRVVNDDPYASVRSLPKPLVKVLTAEQGCLQCHAFRGSGARSHHTRAVDGKTTGGDALALEEYPREVLQHFLFEQDRVAQIFGVAPIRLEKSTATLLFQEIAH